MTTRNSSTRSRQSKAVKPEKPRPDFPLYPHACGQWAKTIDGKKHYFGPWADPDAAERNYLNYVAQQADERSEGEEPLHECFNQYLTARWRDVEGNQKLSRRQYNDLENSCKMIAAFFGRDRTPSSITPLDWQRYRAHLDSRYGVHRYNNEITRTRQIFKWCHHFELCSEVRFGPDFTRVRTKQMRAEEGFSKTVIFEDPAELQLMIGKSDEMLRAALLLGINAGFNNADIAYLPLDAQYQDGWLEFPRAKTHQPRLSPLWEETIEALDEYKQVRPKPTTQEGKNLLFLTRLGNTWVEDESNSRLSNKFDQKALRLGIKRPRLSFRSVRKTFSAVGQNAQDSDALKFLLGHTDSSMLRHYAEGKHIDRQRLTAVTDHVYRWLHQSDRLEEGEDGQHFAVVG